jgi:tetratricopeptide (TPR) repeat protein
VTSGGAPGAGADRTFLLACDAFHARSYDSAARLAGDAIASSPATAGLHGLLAAALLAARRPVLAVGACERARALAPDVAWPWRLRAFALAEMRRGEEAVASAESAVRLAPLDPWAHDVLARSLAAAGRLAEARTAAREAVRLAPRDPDLVRRAGDTWVTDDPKAAEARYREAIALDPTSAAGWDALAGALTRQLRDEDAAAARERAAALDPAFAERYRRQRAFVPLLQLGAGLLLAIFALSLAPRLVPPRAVKVTTAVLWVVVLLAPALFAIGAAVALQRGPRHPAPPDPQVADVVSRLRT